MTDPKQNEVTLTFVLNEEVTPDIFAERVAMTLGQHYTLREGEGVLLPSDPEKALRISKAPMFRWGS